MGTKSLPGQWHPGGVPWVNSALWCGGSPVRNPGGTPIFWPLPFRGDRLETKKGARELGLKKGLLQLQLWFRPTVWTHLQTTTMHIISGSIDIHVYVATNSQIWLYYSTKILWEKCQQLFQINFCKFTRKSSLESAVFRYDITSWSCPFWLTKTSLIDCTQCKVIYVHFL